MNVREYSAILQEIIQYSPLVNPGSFEFDEIPPQVGYFKENGVHPSDPADLKSVLDNITEGLEE